MLRTLEVKAIGGGLRTRFQPVSGYSQYWQPVVDGVQQGPPIYGDDDVVTEVIGIPNPTQSAHVVSICPMGDWSFSNFDVTHQQTYFEAARADRIRVTMTPTVELFSTESVAQLSSWSLTGLRRFSNCAPYPRRRQQAYLDVTLATSGGTRTLTLKANGVTVASGTRTVAAGDGTITLTASNNSGLSGSVTLTYTADIAAAALVRLIARYPASYPIHYRTSAFGGGDFPRTAEGAVSDDGHSSKFVFRSSALAAGTYRVVAHQKDDAGNESTNTDAGGATATVVGVPNPPGTPAYSSGGAAATDITFAASSTTNATYNIYDSGIAGVIDFNAVTGTHIAGTGTLTQTLPAISGTFTGYRYVIVRAVSTLGVEEGNSVILTIEYDTGVVVPSRPNAPGIGQAITISGRTITVPCFISTSDQLIAASDFAIWLVANGTAINYAAAPTATQAVSSAVGTLINTSISATAGSDGDYQFAIRSRSAAGTQSTNTDQYGPFRLTTTAPNGPATTLVEVGY